ncbi:MAG TPA: cell division protein FtsZ, partial [Thauera aminoaromatica]|nr:cell division protein FtsZ [Thauera aminoaromatica]
MFEIVEKEATGTVIKVVGVGGAGGNAVDHMIREGVKGVHFISANTDAQALKRCLAPVKVQLGITGLGADSKPEAGRAAAQESRDAISAALE